MPRQPIQISIAAFASCADQRFRRFEADAAPKLVAAAFASFSLQILAFGFLRLPAFIFTISAATAADCHWLSFSLLHAFEIVSSCFGHFAFLRLIWPDYQFHIADFRVSFFASLPIFISFSAIAFATLPPVSLAARVSSIVATRLMIAEAEARLFFFAFLRY